MILMGGYGELIVAEPNRIVRSGVGQGIVITSQPRQSGIPYSGPSGFPASQFKS